MKIVTWLISKLKIEKVGYDMENRCFIDDIKDEHRGCKTSVDFEC